MKFETPSMLEHGAYPLKVKPSEEEPIRALSWWNPFGFLMFYHKIETRTWSTNYRGKVLICTTKKPLEKQKLDDTRHVIVTISDQKQINVCKGFEQLQPYDAQAMNGFAIGIGTLIDCRKVKFDDLTYFSHGSELFAHIYKDVQRIKPFPIKGSQGWFKVTPEIRAKIELL